MNKYNFAKIYIIICLLNPDLFYIGSTITALKVRFIGHKSRSKTLKKASKLHKVMNEYGNINFKIELLEDINCQSKRELVNKEIEWINKMKPTLNTVYKCNPNINLNINPYHEGKIYKITCLLNLALLYIGSTMLTIEKRFIKHKKDSKKDNSLLYQKMRKYGVENFKIELVCIIKCENEFELVEHEKIYTKQLNANMNQRNMGIIGKRNKKIQKPFFCECCNFTAKRKGRHVKSQTHINNLKF